MLPFFRYIGIFLVCINLFAFGQDVNQLDTLIQTLHKTDKPSDKIEILNQLSAFYEDSNHDRALSFAKQALFIAESIHDKEALTNSKYYLASLLTEKKDNHQATELLLDCEESFLRVENKLMLAKTKLLLGHRYQDSFQSEKSLRVLFEALELFKSLGLKKDQAQTLNSIGGNYYDLNELDKAFEYYSQSYDLYQSINDLEGEGKLENNLGEILRLQGDFNTALKYYNRALKIHKALGNKKYLSIIYDNIATTYLGKKSLDSAHFFLQKSLQFAIEEGNPDLISSAKINYGKIFVAEHQYDSVLPYLQSGYSISKQSGNLIILRNACEVLSNFYTQKPDFKKALKYEYEYTTISDSIDNINNNEAITQLEMKLIFDHEEDIRALQIQRDNLKYLTLAAAIISLAIILILLYGRLHIIANHSKLKARNLQLEREHLQDEIDYKNRELATNVMYMVSKNELINAISEKLFKVKTHFNKKAENKLQEIILDLQSNVDKDIWGVFQQRFKEVHSEFYKKLTAYHPHLTDNDLRLCAFIKLNMSTKEIASITHQNPNTIDVSRTRLRKKLKLSNKEISLNNFLSNL